MGDEHRRVSEPEVVMHDLYFPHLQKLPAATLDEHLAALQRYQQDGGSSRAAAAERADLELEKAIRDQDVRARVRGLVEPRGACSGLDDPGYDPDDDLSDDLVVEP